jgi:tRNA1(Val) A37 N6-methylase TrmN6
MRLDYFIRPDVKVWQNPDHFCFNTDTALLAKFVQFKRKDSVLDIGTNNGVLLVWADQFGCARLDGIEILEDAYKAAQKNREDFIHCPGDMILGDVNAYDQRTYSLILSNPPYFPLKSTHPDTPLTMRQLGRVEQNLNFDELVKAAARLLEAGGRFCFVHRPDRLNDLFFKLHENHFSVSRIQFVYDSRDGQCKTVLIEARKEANSSLRVEEPIYL